MKNTAAARQRRLKLQTSYGQALLWSRGFAAEEAKAAFTRARELAAGFDHPPGERFATYYGLWLGSLNCGELAIARETAEAFLREAKIENCSTEAAVASRNLGLTCLIQGDVTEARAHLEEALRIHDPIAIERPGPASPRIPAPRRRFSSLTQLGCLVKSGRARALIEEGVARAVETGHVPTLANTYTYKILFEELHGSASAVRRAAETLVELGREHGLAGYLPIGNLHLCWACAQLGNRATVIKELRQALAAFTDQGSKLYVHSCKVSSRRSKPKRKAQQER